MRDEQRANGPEGFIGFAVSARMNPVLREEIEAIPAEKWKPYSEDSGAVKECAQVDYFPEETAANRYREPLRTIAIRIRKKQEELFADGSASEALRGAHEPVGLETETVVGNGIARRRARLRRCTTY